MSPSVAATAAPASSFGMSALSVSDILNVAVDTHVDAAFAPLPRSSDLTSTFLSHERHATTVVASAPIHAPSNSVQTSDFGPDDEPVHATDSDAPISAPTVVLAAPTQQP
jgi:hypothetical protein